jgi:L-malate glycosyltransferase
MSLAFNSLDVQLNRDLVGARNERYCRLVYLIGELNTGGSERQLYYLLRGMDRDRYRPRVVVWNYSDSDFHLPLIRELGVPVHALPRDTSRLAKLTALRRLIAELDPEVVHSWSFYINFAAYWATRGSKTVCLGSIRSDFSWAVNESGAVLGRLNGLRPNRQICNSFSAAETIRTLKRYAVPARVFVVPNGVDLDPRRNFPAPTTKPTHILGIGYLLPVKRWDRLIAAAQILNQKRLDFRINIAGDGPLLSKLKRITIASGVGEQIQFLGHVNDLSSLLARSAFVVHTAEAEGSPNAVMEAMASGRAVIATEAGDIPNLIEDGKTGFVVRGDYGSALAERMARLINDSNLCADMGRAARAKAEREFGMDRLVTETLEAYRSSGWMDA